MDAQWQKIRLCKRPNDCVADMFLFYFSIRSKKISYMQPKSEKNDDSMQCQTLWLCAVDYPKQSSNLKYVLCICQKGIGNKGMFFSNDLMSFFLGIMDFDGMVESLVAMLGLAYGSLLQFGSMAGWKYCYSGWCYGS